MILSYRDSSSASRTRYKRSSKFLLDFSANLSVHFSEQKCITYAPYRMALERSTGPANPQASFRGTTAPIFDLGKERWMDVAETKNVDSPPLFTAELSEHVLDAERISQLSSWMMMLGTVRLICMVGDYARSYVEMSRTGLFSLRAISLFVQAHPPAVVLGFAWPLAIGIILRRTGRSVFLPAAAVTFCLLSLGGCLALAASLLVTSASHIAIGSFDVPRGALLQLKPTAIAKAIMGMSQLLLELSTAISAWILARRIRYSRDPQRAGGSSPSSRRYLQGRLALYVSIAFLVLTVRLPVWSAYLEVLNRSRLVREFVLQNDVRRHVPYRRVVVDPADVRRGVDLDQSLVGALRHAGENQFTEAKNDYLRIIGAAESMSADSDSAGFRAFHLGRALNNLSWLLATCPDETMREPVPSVSYAKRAVEIAPDEGTYWNTLGVAYFRNGNLQAAMTALERSMELRHEGDSFDWYFVAMIHAKVGRPDEARKWYDKAVAWQADKPDDELHRFRIEAAQVLQLPTPPPVPHDAKRAMPGDMKSRFIPGLERRRPRLGSPMIKTSDTTIQG
jgi:tetratricopeptide (TPR) repeat protein